MVLSTQKFCLHESVDFLYDGTPTPTLHNLFFLYSYTQLKQYPVDLSFSHPSIMPIMSRFSSSAMHSSSVAFVFKLLIMAYGNCIGFFIISDNVVFIFNYFL